MDMEEVVILQKEVQMIEAEEIVNKLVEALTNESFPFEDKCSVMAMLHHLLRNTCCDTGYNIAMHSLMATANIKPESPNLAMFAHFTNAVLLKNAGHFSPIFPQIVLSLMKADQHFCDEDLKQKTLLAIWNNQELLNLPLEVLELMALRWKLGLESECLQLCYNKEHIPEYLIKLCASSPRVFQACLSILTSFLLEYNGHQQIRRLFRDLMVSVAVTYPTLWKLFPVSYQKLVLFLQGHGAYQELWALQASSSLTLEAMEGRGLNLRAVREYRRRIPGLVDILGSGYCAVPLIVQIRMTYIPEFREMLNHLWVDPDICPEEFTAGINRDFILDLVADEFYNAKNSNIVPGLIILSCFPKWLPYLVEFFNKKYKKSIFTVACFGNKYYVTD